MSPERRLGLGALWRPRRSGRDDRDGDAIRRPAPNGLAVAHSAPSNVYYLITERCRGATRCRRSGEQGEPEPSFRLDHARESPTFPYRNGHSSEYLAGGKPGWLPLIVHHV